MSGSILSLLTVFGAYALLFIPIPWLFLGYKMETGKCIERIVGSLAVGMMTAISLIYLLAFLHILSTATMYLGILAVITAAILIFKRQWAKETYENLLAAAELISTGYYKPLTLIKNMFSSGKRRLREMIRIFFKEGFVCNITFAVSLAYLVYLITYHSLNRYVYALSDLYSHTQWLAALRENDLFYRGVYPFGMHNSVMSLSLVFGLDTVTLLRFYGCVSGTVFMLGIYMLFTRIFRSRYAASMAILLYVFVELAGISAYYRIGVSLPQETGFAFMLPAASFFIDYVRDKEKEKLGLFGVTLALVIACHFYAALALFFFCASFFAVHFLRIIKRRMLLPLIGAATLAFLTAFLPMGTGLLLGTQWEQSMNWATESMNFKEEETLTEEEKAEIAAMAFVDFQNLDQKKIIYLRGLSFSEKFQRDNLLRAVDAFLENVTLTFPLFAAYLFVMLLSFFYALLSAIFRKDKFTSLTLLGTTICAMIFFVMAFSVYLNLPTLFSGGRIIIFSSYFMPAMYGICVEIFFANRFMEKRKVLSSILFLLYAAGIMTALLTITNHREPINLPIAQYDGAVTAHYQIKREFPRNSWTIISPVEELSMVTGHGYHYELWEFVHRQSEYLEIPEWNIPTKHLFFYVEKYPIPVWAEDQTLWNIPYNPLDYAAIPFFEVYGSLAITDYYTQWELRRVLFAKMQMWVEAYAQYFPDEMSVYYEDEEIVVYHLEQNEGYYDNLILDYGYN